MDWGGIELRIEGQIQTSIGWNDQILDNGHAVKGNGLDELEWSWIVLVWVVVG